MGKVFTITEGLENLGAMKTGGQGSVYKGRRIGEIITAIKLLPTPIYSESLDDKNFADFQNEVQKLKKVNENPNPNVVKILSSGVSDTGNFPFIEMEYVEGPELEELIKPPHDPIFTIKEALKVAEQLSHALAHCHKVGVRHGDIKSNNVKFNIHTYNYVLLDFGLAVMSDEQRRSSLRHAGAIEFMAPEQNEGQMLFQTDVYSFGVILFELLAGTVPFPLQDKGETARNIVRISHMETPPPDLLELRRNALPEGWSMEKKEHEMHVPAWLVSMIYRCLEKKPEARFANGIELHEYIVFNSTLAAKQEEASAEQSETLMQENATLLTEKEQLLQVIQQYRRQANEHEKELDELKGIVARQDSEIQSGKQGALIEPAYAESTYTESARTGVSKTSFIALLVVTILLAVFSAYSLFKNNSASQQASDLTNDSTGALYTGTDTTMLPGDENNNQTKTEKQTEDDKKIGNKPAVLPATKPNTQTTEAENAELDNQNTNDGQSTDNQPQDDPEKTTKSIGRYKVVSKAFFHDEANEETKRDAFIVHWNNAVLKAQDEKDGFVYVVFTNHLGQTSKGWLRKKDLTRIGD